MSIRLFRLDTIKKVLKKFLAGREDYPGVEMICRYHALGSKGLYSFKD